MKRNRSGFAELAAQSTAHPVGHYGPESQNPAGGSREPVGFCSSHRVLPESVGVDRVAAHFEGEVPQT